MGRKNTLNNYKVISAGDMSGNLVSKVTDVQFMDNIGFQVNILSGTATGTFSVDVSADYAISLPTETVTNTGNWTSLTTATITSGSPTQTFFNLDCISAPFIRVSYTAGTGSGTCDVIIVGKSI